MLEKIRSLSLRSKIVTLMILAIIVCVVIGVLYFVRLESPSTTKISEAGQMHQNLKSEMEIITNYPSIYSRLDKQFAIIDNPDLDEEKRYIALTEISSAIADAYYYSNQPFFRKYITTTLNNYAKANFPKQYNQLDFAVNCSDSECGDQIPTDIQVIIDTVNTIDTDEIFKESIVKNITNMSYLNENQVEEKTTAASYALGQLGRENSPASSNAAQLLREYFTKKYNLEI